MGSHAGELTLQDLPAFGLAMLIIVLFMFGSTLWHGRRALRKRGVSVGNGVRTLARMPSVSPDRRVEPVSAWLPLLFELAAHIIILGGSGSGKTRTARALVRFIAEQRGERVVVLDPKANKDTWMGLPVRVRPDDIDAAMRSLLEEFQRRLNLNPTLTEVEAEQTFERVWVVIDEVSFVRDNCKLWLPFLRRISSMARSLKLHLVVVNQSERVEELGLRGRGDLLANFAKIGLSQAVWQGEPAVIALGTLTIHGAWLSHVPEAYRGRALPPAAAYPMAVHGTAAPVPAGGTAAPPGEPAWSRWESGAGNVGTSADPFQLADLLADRVGDQPDSESEAEKICRLSAQGWSRNQIAAELGGRRSDVLARIRMVLDVGDPQR